HHTIYTLSLHDALPIYAYVERLIGTLRRGSLSRPENRQHVHSLCIADDHFTCVRGTAEIRMSAQAESQSSQIIRLNVGDFFTSTDRKSTRLNSSHGSIS